MQHPSKFFKTHEVYEGVTAISGLIGELAFLVRGREKALLIDTLTGLGSLKAFCRELTDLPLTVVNTHGHVDHVGSNAEFERVYIHPLDIDMSYYQMTAAKKAAFLGEAFLATLKEKGITKDDFVQERPFYAIPIVDGDYFDLGGKTIEAIQVKGHSHGSIALLDMEERKVFIGDALTSGTLMFLEQSTSIEEYLEGLTYFKTHAHRFDRMIWSHNLEHLTAAQIDEMMEVCREILEGRDDAAPYPAHPFYIAKKRNEQNRRVDGKWANISYDRNKVFRGERGRELVPYASRCFNMYD